MTECKIFFGFSGIFYQNTPGTVDHVTVRNEDLVCGNGIFVEGGSSDPSVTIQNNSVHDFDGVGIAVEAPSSGLKATIKNNYVRDTSSGLASFGIWLDCCASTLVTGNVVVGSYGIGGINTDFNGVGSVAGNTIILGGIVANGPAAVTSNNILDSPIGVWVGNPSNSVKSNTITNSNVGIEFFCVANPNVSSNVINDAGVGVHDVPAGLATPKNSYSNVLTIRTTC